MADLKTKRQGIVSFDQIITFGQKVRNKIVRKIHDLQKKSRSSSYYGAPGLKKSPPRLD